MINYFCLFCYCCLNLLLFSTLVSSESLTKSEVRSQKFLASLRRYRTEVVFVTRIYASLQKRFAVKSQALDPIISVNTNSQQVKTLANKQTRYLAESEIINPEDSENNINTEPSVNTRNEGNFIAGLWRGFHESEGLMIYYGYQFRPDGSFVARHRIYQERETLEDITWQGEWQFRDNTLILKAFNSKNKTQQVTFELKLTDTFKLAYETGSLSDAYQMMILNKITL